MNKLLKKIKEKGHLFRTATIKRESVDKEARTVKIAFSSDCHTVEEVGNFDHQFELLRRLGLSLSDIPFWRPKNF